MESLHRVHVIGMGEVGRRLAAALDAAGVEVQPVTRHGGWDELRADPDALRLVCVREEALPGLLEQLSGLPPRTTVLVQNGWIRPLLGELDELTRGLIWFTAKGGFFKQLRTSPFSGPAAIPLARCLARGGLDVVAVSAADFDALDAEKMGFNCVVGLPLAVSGLSLAEYLEQRAIESRAVFDEAVTACAAAVGMKPLQRWWPDFLASARHLGWVRVTRAKALEYRNGAVVGVARELGVPTPVNERLLEADARAMAADRHGSLC